MIVADPLPIATPRTVLRRLSTDDLHDFQAYRTDPEVGLYQGWVPVLGAQALAFLARMRRAPLFVPGEWAQIGIALRPGAALETPLIGDIGIGIDADDPCDLPRAAVSRASLLLRPRTHDRGQASGLTPAFDFAGAVQNAGVRLKPDPLSKREGV
jgi:hypothetical protein